MYDRWMPQWRRLLEDWPRDGYLVNFLSTPVLQADKIRLFSACVRGLDEQWPGLAVLGRLEWLAFELVVQAMKALEQSMDSPDDKTWLEIEKFLEAKRSEVLLRVLITPHKMQLVDGELESKAPGANGRSDIHLVASHTGSGDTTVLATAYHTTNVVQATTSPNDDLRNMESRILWTDQVDLDTLAERSAKAVVDAIEADRVELERQRRRLFERRRRRA